MSIIPVPPPPPAPPSVYYLPSELLEDDEFAEKRQQKELQFHLVSAIERGNVELLQELIAKGVNTNCTLVIDKTPLSLALDNIPVNENIVQLLVDADGTDINLADRSPLRLKPLHMAAARGSLTLIKIISDGSKRDDCNIDVKDSGLATPLHHAAWFGHAEIVKHLLLRGCDVNSKDDCGRTALHRACEKQSLEVANALLNNGAYINATDNFGWSPLFDSVFFLKTDVVEYLLKLGASPDLKDVYGKSLLDLACYNNVSSVHSDKQPERVVLATSFYSYARKRGIPSQELQMLIFLLDHRVNDDDTFKCVKLLLNAGLDPKLFPVDGFKTESLTAAAKVRVYLALAGAFLSPLDPWVHEGSSQITWRHWFQIEVQQQMSLKRRCRYHIRSYLSCHGDVDDSIKQLPIPEVLKRILRLEGDFEAFLRFAKKYQ
ncbi:serine/threonine-protein phosphatase 6 regulatory ankyrin repeat subunit C-like [Dreissena polymorpha]|uniref:SOCS box domain-containing protein n=1 Tax=Dreissena polymorpha TaxID=45954 RepID=A0A9D4GXW1_DREPO|nr:serine/threonine-protein phosphatase 6 regulatory ankyrin repeat subunit C-like [Dreissena polymorpha]KAH3823665.1 hypothetical protein DPMN_125478 [Dreissena polymorpha]